jgi:RNA polymerase sigma factor (sigma-70 family)
MAGKPLGSAARYLPRLFGAGTVVGLSDSELLDRYTHDGDPVAFEALVGRHGPMVLAVCRGILKDPDDAQDAFQATFLVLVRRAGSLWSIKGSLGSWLYRVAQRIAIRAKVESARRRTIEARAGRRSVSPNTESEAISALHEEIGRLPEKFRTPIVLCHLEQLSYAQAAEQLGWSPDTVRGRLARGRDLLRSRLARRGAIPAIGGLAALLPERQILAAVPRSWVEAGVQAAAKISAGEAIEAGTVSAAATAFSEEVLRVMGIHSLLKIAASALIGVTALAWGASAALVDGPSPAIELAQAPAKTTRTAKPAPKPADDDETGTLDVRGRVVDPDGKPLEGAEIYLFQRYYSPTPGDGIDTGPPRAATSDRDGRFHFPLDKGVSDWLANTNYRGWRADKIVAVKPGYGPARIEAEAVAKGEEATLIMVRDDVPIMGHVLDTQGRPVVGATVKILSIGIPKPDVDLDAALASSEVPRGQFETWYFPNPASLGLSAFPKTDADGRFEVRGIGQDRLAGLKIDSPVVQALNFYAMTRPLSVPQKPRPQASTPVGQGMLRMLDRPAPRLYGSEIEVIVGAAKPIVGIVRSKKTGEPIAGATVNGNEYATNTHVHDVSDGEGRFRLDGLPKASSYELHVVPRSGEPLLTQSATINDTEGLKPIETTIELLPGVVVRGRLVDRATGEAVPALEIQYLPLPSNPIRATPRSQAAPDRIFRKTKSFEMTVPPGGGMIIGSVANQDGQFVRAHLRKEDKGKGIGSLKDKEASMIPMEAFQAYKIVEVPADAKDFSVDLELVRGLSRKGTVVDPDGKPISGVHCSGLNPGWEAVQVLAGDTFEAKGLAPAFPRRIFFAHQGRKLTGLIDLPGDPSPNLAPVEVRLHPAGTVKGRFVDEDGLPLAGVQIKVVTLDLDNLAMSTLPGRAKMNWPADEVFTTDADGKFQIVGFFPDAESVIGIVRDGRPDRRYQRNLALRNLKLGPGEVRDIGTVTMKLRPTGQ